MGVVADAARAAAAPPSAASRAHTLTTVLDRVSSAVAIVTGHAVPADAPLTDANVDSLGAVELRSALASAFGIDVPPTVVYDYPTVAALAAWVCGLVCGAEKEGVVQAAAVAVPLLSLALPPPPPPSTTTIVIDAVAGRLPTGRALASPTHTDAVRPIALSRWDCDDRRGAPPPSRFGARVPGVALFDAAAFSLPPAEATAMDPVQRLLLEDAAALVPGAGAATAVAIGVARLVDDDRALVTSTSGPYDGTGRALSVVAGRLSYTFNLTGACVTVDTACSSSLVAVATLLPWLKDGSATAGLAAGVNAPTGWRATSAFAGAGMLAPDGRCKALDAGADGYGRGEASAVLRLKGVASGAIASLPAASVIVSGACVNQDGRSSSLTAPNGPAQQCVVRGALGLAPPLSTIAMHGTGTPLGDPLEVGALVAVCGGAGAPLALTAPKTAAAHGETAAGATSLARVYHRLKACAVDPILNLRTVNPHVVAAVGRAAVWAPRAGGAAFGATTGVSAFAFQGTNAHVVLAPGVAAGAADVAAPTWTARRAVTAAPPRHRLLLRAAVAASDGRVTPQVDLGCARLAYLWEHRVSVCMCVGRRKEGGGCFFSSSAHHPPPLPNRSPTAPSCLAPPCWRLGVPWWPLCTLVPSAWRGPRCLRRCCCRRAGVVVVC